MSDIFSEIEADHQGVLRLVEELQTPGMEDEARARIAERLVIEESKHEAAEEMWFWPAVREHLQNGEGLRNVGLDQEDAGKKLLQQLEKAGPSTAEFDRLLAEVVPAVRAHIDYEQSRVWPDFRKALTPAEAHQLGDKFRSSQQHAPTRPHPHTPDDPAVLKTAGRAAAMMDRARDALTHRGD